MGVIVLHYNNISMGKGLVVSQGIANVFLWFLECQGGRHQCGQKMRLFQIPDDMTLASQADFDKF